MSPAVATEGPIRDVATGAQRVLDQIGPPLHLRATIAALESEGLRDTDATLVVPGCANLFDLGPVVHQRCLEMAEAAATLAPAADGPSPLDEAPRTAFGAAVAARVRRVGRDYWIGIAYTLPLIAQGLCVAFLGVSLWGSRGLARDQQAAIALALVVSLIVTGPLTHAMTRRLFYYWFQWDLDAVRRTALRWTAAGTAVGALAAAAVAGALAATGRLDAASLTFVVFLALQPAIWMANSALFVIRQAPIAALAILLPTIPVWAALRAGLPALPVHAAGLLLADALLIGATWYLMRRRARGWPSARRALPRAILPLAVAGYAAWGLVYFGLIFSDRIIAWSDGGAIAWRPAYEAALQIALLPMLLTLPLLEHVLVRMGALMKRGEGVSTPATVRAAYRRAEGVFMRMIATAVAVYAALACAVWVVVDLYGDHLPMRVGRLVGEGDGRLALAAALAAYGFFVVALGIGAVYQLLGRPWPMVVAGVLALVTDITVGVVARSQGPPEYAAFGLLAGGVVFALAMAVVWSRTRRRMGYWWYAAS